MKIPPRINELCERLTSPGHCPSKLSASEFHELVDFIFSLEDKSVEPLTCADLTEIAMSGVPIPPLRALATYANENNWKQIYNGESTEEYVPKACEWAFVGPVRPGYELAQNALIG